MSSNQQLNGKKSSGSNSLSNTPSTTPVNNSALVIPTNSQSALQSSNQQALVGVPPLPPNQQQLAQPPPPTNAPKYGTLVPNRVFVGGIAANTTESELLEVFSRYGTVKAAKIIQDRAGVSKGYGFVTFETEEEAKRLQREDNIVHKERRLNIAPAIKKQPFNRTFEGASPPSLSSAPAQYYMQPNNVPYYQGGVAYYTPQPQAPPGDPNSQQPPVYPAQAMFQPTAGPPQAATYPSMLYPTQQMYVPQQFATYQPLPYDYSYYPNGNSQYIMGGGNQVPGQHQQPSLQPPGSPTRNQCFNQMSYPPDTLFINVPMYGQMDPVYTDTIDMNNGPVPEISQAPTPSGNGSQNFIPPARRNRRSLRRNPQSAALLSEIGAGDAPLPTPEIGDACKKLDNLKL